MTVRIARSGNELTHWGIKGQKWGVRRYQNPDGSYTEEGIKRYQRKYPYQNPDGSLTESGQKNFMKAARKNKLDYKRLSDKDLDMINNRFNKENQYKRNIENYEKSTFKYRVKEAIIARLKGGGKEGGDKKKKKGDSLIGKILAQPVKKAIEDAFKDDKAQRGKEVVEEHKKKPVNKVDKNPPVEKTAEQKRQEREAARRRQERELEERAAKSGIIIAHKGTTHYKVTRKKPKDYLTV